MLRLPSDLSRIWLALILVGFAVLATIYSLVTPVFEASDELWHYPMIKYLADHNLSLPVQDPANPGPWRQEGGQPPLYYMIGAAATFWIDTSDMESVRRINPHADIGIVVPDGNVNMVVHSNEREGFPWRGTVLAMHIVRFISILMGLGTVYLTYQLARELFPQKSMIALAAAAFAAFNPMFLFISAVINNDNLSTLLATWILLLIVRLLRHNSANWRFYVLLGLAAGAGMLAKFQIGFLLPLIALALLIVSIRRRDWRPIVIGGLISGGLTILIAGWWYWRNYDLYGDATGINVFLDIVGRRAVPADLRQLWTERETFMMAFWGFFGGVNVPMHDNIYRLFNLLVVFSLLGFVIGAVRLFIRKSTNRLPSPFHAGRGTVFDPKVCLRGKRRGDPVGRPAGRASPTPTKPTIQTRHAKSVFPSPYHGEGIEGRGLIPLARLFALIWPVIVFLSLISWTRQTWASQGRLWFSAIAPLSLWMAVGLSLYPRPVRSVLLGLASAVFVFVAALTPITTIHRAYSFDETAPFESDHEMSGQRAACFAEPGADRPALCAAFQPLGGSILPGEYLKFSPIFTVTGDLTRDWSFFVHLINEDGLIEAQRDVYPGGGQLATSDLKIDDTWNNGIAVHIPEGLYTPQTLNVYLGLYDLQRSERMITSGTGADTERNRIYLGQIQLETPPGDVPNPVDVNFDGKLRLLGYEIDDRSLAPGDQTTLTLYWETSSRIDTGYVISIQVIDPVTFTKAAQDDTPPTPPTTEWNPGEQIVVSRPLSIFPDAGPGRYRVMVRVYPAGDAANPLRIVTEAGGQSEDFVWLNWIQVE